MDMHTLTIVVSVVVIGSFCLYAIGEIRSFVGRRKRARAAQSFVSVRIHGAGRQAEVSQGIYAVGSPEHNAQIVAMLRQVNEGLAPQGKRVPEKVVIDIIGQELESFSQEESE